MLDIATRREAFRENVISNIGSDRSSKYLADGLTKVMNQTALQNVLDEGTLHIQLNYWIVCTKQTGHGTIWHK